MVLLTLFCKCGETVPLELREGKKCQKCLDKEQIPVRSRKELIGLNIKDLTETEKEILEKYELNICDKCGCIESTYDLIWICEDFTPRKNEHIGEGFFKRWGDSALCEGCYVTEIKLFPKTKEDKCKKE